MISTIIQTKIGAGNRVHPSGSIWRRMFLLFLLPALAHAQYEWRGATLTGGGGVMTSSIYRVSHATAQPGEAGTASAGMYRVRYGVLGWSASGESEDVPHPADLNRDWRLAINEAISYLSGWQGGSNPIAYAIRAAYLWQNGEHYVYDSALSAPLCWTLK